MLISNPLKKVAPLIFSLVQLFPLPLSLLCEYCKYTVYSYTVCKGGSSGSKTDKHLPQSPFAGKFFKMTTFCIDFYESYISMVQ
jgi:hypothetical protein